MNKEYSNKKLFSSFKSKKKKKQAHRNQSNFNKFLKAPLHNLAYTVIFQKLLSLESISDFSLKTPLVKLGSESFL